MPDWALEGIRAGSGTRRCTALKRRVEAELTSWPMAAGVSGDSAFLAGLPRDV